MTALGDPRERPTAGHESRDLSAGSAGASAAAEGRRPAPWQRKLVEECLCGGPAIVSATWLAQDIVDAVRRHQVEPVHIAWDRSNGTPLALWQRVAGGFD